MKIVQLMNVPPDQRDPTWLRNSLQAAIELEHATLPPYLSGLWSIKDQQGAAFDLIRSVVLEEMLHMGLSCNMLATIGGSPDINKADFIPNYPGHLPGGVRPKLTVRLQGLTRDYVHEVFMQIEYPEQGPVTSHLGQTLPTIGAFYDAILGTFDKLVKAGTVTISGQNQVSGPVGVFAITSLNDVHDAITEIKEQGEGTPKTPVTHPQDFGPHAAKELAHYYKFAEIYNGRKLIHLDGQWQYKGDPIPFPDTYPMAVVPKGGYPAAPKDVQQLEQEFNTNYSRLLDDLHTAWNGEPDKMGEAVGKMFGLAGLARQLMQKPLDPSDAEKGNYGPTFRYVPA